MKMMGKILLGVCLCALAHGVAVDDFKKANADFEAGHYTEAAEAYEGILKSEGPRTSVLKNLGSAYFKAGDNGRAILAFERALVLHPRDPDLRANLELARKQAALFPVNDESGWKSFLARYSARHWSITALVAGLLVPLAALGWVLMPGKRRLGLAAFVVLDLMVVGIAMTALNTRPDDSSPAIVLGKPATVRISPFEKADARGTIAEGRKLTLGEQNNGYHWVSVDEGSLEGWVQESEVAPVIPR